MLRQVLPAFAPIGVQVRGMATLKDIKMRLKSVKNIQKITKSMKMVSAAKFGKAEKELKPARAYGKGADAFFKKAEVAQDAAKPNHLIVAMTSDRGLCGAVHSTIIKQVKSVMAQTPAGRNVKIVCVGDKSKAVLGKLYPSNVLFSVNEIGRMPPVFADASKIAQAILNSGYTYDYGELFYNTFRSVVAYRLTAQPLFAPAIVSQADKLSNYDSLDDEVLRSYNEFALANLLFFALKEGAASEQSARMTAMDGASKNAGEVISKLTLTYNRTRQAVITKELIEIISGAAAIAN